MTHVALEGPHWAFALRLYGQPGVAEACLLLQDRLGVDVDVLLLAMYAAKQRGIELDHCDLQAMDAAVAPWREEIVVALRAIRRRMKTGPEPAPSESTERLRAEIKAAELHAEQIELAVLAGWLDRHAAGRESSPADMGGVLRTVVAHFAGGCGAASGDAGDTEIEGALRTLEERAARVGADGQERGSGS
jgi:uncharacterized protein (TIGR02444 family)